MEITAGPFCTGTTFGDEVYFAAPFPPLQPVIHVPNAILGRLALEGAATKEGWIQMFEEHRDEIEAAVRKAIASDDVAPNGEILLKAKHFPAGRV